MALLPLQDLSEGGVPTMVAATGGGDTMPQGIRAGGWDQGVCLLVRNTDAAPKNVTVAGMPLVAVPATTGLAIIPVYGIHGAGPGNIRAITYSATANLTVAAIRMAGD